MGTRVRLSVTKIAKENLDKWPLTYTNQIVLNFQQFLAGLELVLASTCLSSCPRSPWPHTFSSENRHQSARSLGKNLFLCLEIQFCIMAFATVKLFAAVLIMAIFASFLVSAQDFGELSPTPAPAPGPGMDKGASTYSFGMSGALICSSLFFSLLALLRH
ncbi:unnamed protein product [Dovyalis caffra]|uniref:Uncharacterized protein n=1 Tax=Dovyalis caffra TaxID=77055 RepID=A0AAV1RAH6_9ROSI|nr:unnamed protein product [Dovyalis caffra]